MLGDPLAFVYSQVQCKLLKIPRNTPTQLSTPLSRFGSDRVLGRTGVNFWITEISDFTPTMKCSWVYFVMMFRLAGAGREPGQVPLPERCPLGEKC